MGPLPLGQTALRPVSRGPSVGVSCEYAVRAHGANVTGTPAGAARSIQTDLGGRYPGLTRRPSCLVALNCRFIVVALSIGENCRAMSKGKGEPMHVFGQASDIPAADAP